MTNKELIELNNRTKITAVISRGENAGMVMKPFMDESGMYVASMDRYAINYVHVSSIHELLILIRNGFSIRMENPNVSGPSLICPDSLTIEPHTQG